jgi:hypothetical protein
MTALANKIDDGPVFLSLLQVFDTQTAASCRLNPQARRRASRATITFAFHACMVRTLPQRASLFIRQPVSHSHTVLFQALHAPNSCGQIGTEQSTICGLVSQAPNGAQPKVDGPGGQSPGFQVTAIPKHHDPIERQPWLRTVPVDEFVNRVPIPSLRLRVAQAVQNCCSGMFQVEES